MTTDQRIDDGFRDLLERDELTGAIDYARCELDYQHVKHQVRELAIVRGITSAIEALAQSSDLETRKYAAARVCEAIWCLHPIPKDPFGSS
jgi:hypothetical protein